MGSVQGVVRGQVMEPDRPGGLKAVSDGEGKVSAWPGAGLGGAGAPHRFLCGDQNRGASSDSRSWRNNPGRQAGLIPE